MKVQLSSMHRETVASSIRVAPASSKSSSGGSGGSSNPTSIHLEAKSIYVKKEIPKEDRNWIVILGCPKCKRDSFETRISRCVTNMVRHHDQDERETDGGKCRNQLGKEFTDEGWLHSFYLGSIKTRFEICKDENGELRYIRANPKSLRWNDHITETDELRDDSLQMQAIYLSRGSRTRSILHCWTWISGRRKGTWRRKDRQTSSLLLIRSTAMQMKQNLLQIQREPQKVQYQIHWRLEQDAVYWIHLCTAQDAGLEFWQNGF